MSTIVLTGGGTAGHVMPHLALKPLLDKYYTRVMYIGSNGIEKDIIKKENIPYYEIDPVKLDRAHIFKNIKLPFKFIKSINDAKKILKEIKPDIVFSKGGYVALPVVIAAHKLKIPVVAHESDLSLGLANKISKLYAKAVCTSFKKTADKLGKKGYYTGSPLLNRSKPLTIHTTKPVLLVTGGSLGAMQINKIIWQAAPELAEKFYVIHQVGKNNISSEIKIPDYHQIEFANNMDAIMRRADIVVSRAGSNTIFELAKNHKPMLLIPLPKGASRGDQIENAKYFNSMGYSKMLFQDALDEERLLLCVNNLYKDRNKYIYRLKNAKIPDGTKKIMQVILKFDNKKDLSK